MYVIAATCDASHVGHIRNCIKDTHITDQGLSLLVRLASVFANITAAVGTIAVDTTAAAAAIAPLLLLPSPRRAALLHAGGTNRGA